MKLKDAITIESLGASVSTIRYDISDDVASNATLYLLEIAALALEKAGSSMRDDLEKSCGFCGEPLTLGCPDKCIK